MSTIHNRGNNLQQGGHASRGYRGKVSSTWQNMISILRSLKPAKTLLTYLLLAVVVSSAYLIASAQSGTPFSSDGVEPEGPGFIISGTVQVEEPSDGTSQSGLEGVEIYMLFTPTEIRLDSYAALEALITPTETPDFPKLIAVTDQNGDYESSFIATDDEGEILIWAQKDGYRFEPDESAWFHFYGYEEYESNFTAIPDVDITITPTFTPTPTSTPAPLSGLVIFGWVQVDDPALAQSDKGLGGVEIYMAFASYPGNVVAVTDENGGYESSFIEIPFDETVRVWAEKDGYRFVPEEEVWRFYAGYYQERQIDFRAYPDEVTVTPITPTFTPSPTVTATPHIEPGLRIFGTVVLGAVDGGNPNPGLGGVDIYMSVDGSGYRVVAVTDENGYYQSDIISMTGEHQIIVWAVKDGYLLEPEAHRWLHLDGYEIRQCDFTAEPTKAGVVVEGYVWVQDDPSDPQSLSGVPGVEILMSISGQNMGVVAITDEDGFFETDFFAFEGDAELHVWPIKEGFSFQSEMNEWHHYQGYEERRVDFLAVSEPGLVVFGSVEVEDPDSPDNELKGLEGADIYLSVDGSGYSRVAITDGAGNYRSDFIPLEGNHNIILWAVKDGYILEPEAHRWLHLDGYEIRQCDFIARPEVPGVVVSGGVWLQETARADNPNWDGIPGVRIRMSISGDDIGVIAITNQAGEFESELIPIEGAAEVRVWPELAGYGFVPVQKTWQHAAGDYEEQDAKFLGHGIATPTPIITPRHTPTPKPTLIPTDTPTATPDPVQGLVVYGRVRRGGTAIDVVDDELAGFEIYVGIGPGAPTLVAITNNYGEYNSGFIPIGVFTSINVFAVKDGYTFEPGMYTWAHPVGFEQRQCDFEAYPEVITPTPSPTVTSTPVVIPPRIRSAEPRLFVSEFEPGKKYGPGMALTLDSTTHLEAAFYEVQFSDDGGASWQVYNDRIDVARGGWINHHGNLDCGHGFYRCLQRVQEYHYRVRALDILGNPITSWSNVINATSMEWPAHVELAEPQPIGPYANNATVEVKIDTQGTYGQDLELSWQIISYTSATYAILEDTCVTGNLQNDKVTICKLLINSGLNRDEFTLEDSNDPTAAEPMPSIRVVVIGTDTLQDPGFSARDEVLLDFKLRPDPIFADVGDDHWAAEAINYMGENGYVTGRTTDGDPIYDPEAQITRAEMAVVLSRSNSEISGYVPDTPTFDSLIFQDLEPDQVSMSTEPSDPSVVMWWTKYIMDIQMEGITSGCSIDPPLYCPNNYVSRAQMATFAVKILHEEGFVPDQPSSSSFKDVPYWDANGNLDWRVKWIEQALFVQLIQDCGTDMETMIFRPDEPASRAEMACMVYNALTQ